MLEARAIDGALLDVNIARVIAKGAKLPRWAAYSEHRPWTVTGHRLLLPVYDASGVMRSVRAWRVSSRAG